jgi:hypothetical protein
VPGHVPSTLKKRLARWSTNVFLFQKNGGGPVGFMRQTFMSYLIASYLDFDAALMSFDQGRYRLQQVDRGVWSVASQISSCAESSARVVNQLDQVF